MKINYKPRIYVTGKEGEYRATLTIGLQTFDMGEIQESRIDAEWTCSMLEKAFANLRLPEERPPRQRKSSRPQGDPIPSKKLSILSPCGNHVRHTINPFYEEEMEKYNAKKEAGYQKIISSAEVDGWKHIHDGDTGAYWRGINPDTNKCEPLPDKYL